MGEVGNQGNQNTDRLREPEDISVTAAGDVYVADTRNSRIQRVDGITGIITTVAGGNGDGFSGDGGQGGSAQLNRPGAVLADGAGNVYIADTRNDRIRHVDESTGIITTLIGTGGSLSTQALADPRRLSLANGNLYISEVDQNLSVVLEVNLTTGVVTTIAGNGPRNYTGSGFPPTMSALNVPRGVAFDGSGTLYIADEDNHRIRVVLPADANNPPSDIAFDNLTVDINSGSNTVVGEASTVDADAGDTHIVLAG